MILAHLGVSGTVTLDDNADRDPHFIVWSYGPDQDEFAPFMTLEMTEPEGSVRLSDLAL